MTAAYHTLGLSTSCQFGVKKYTMPSNEPGSVKARTRNIIKKINGAMPVMYAAFPALLIPLMRIRTTTVHARTRNPNRSRFGQPIPLLMLSGARRTSFLEYMKEY